MDNMSETITLSGSRLEKVVSEPNASGSGEFLTNKEAAKFLRCSTVTFWKIRKDGHVSPAYVGKKMLFRKSDLVGYLDKTKEVAHA